MLFLKQLLSLNFRRIILVILLLALADLAVITWEHRQMAEPAQIRLNTTETDSIRALSQLIRKSSGYKIVYLGDSVVYGSSVPPWETAPFYLEQELRRRFPQKNIQVFNYGYKGYGISENFLMLNTLRGAGVDMIIYGITYGWFNRKPVIEYPTAGRVNPEIFQKTRAARLGMNMSPLDEHPFNRRLNEFLTGHWALYRNRSTLAAKFLNKSLSEKIFDYKLSLYDPITLQKQQIYWRDISRPWYQKNLGAEFAKTSGKIGWINLSDRNPQMGFYRLIMDLAKSEGVTPLFYVTPLNIEMLNRFNKFDHPLWDNNLAALKKNSRPEETNYVDFSEDLSGEYFADSVHLLAPGNKLLAGKIAAEITAKGLIK